MEKSDALARLCRQLDSICHQGQTLSELFRACARQSDALYEDIAQLRMALGELDLTQLATTPAEEAIQPPTPEPSLEEEIAPSKAVAAEPLAHTEYAQLPEDRPPEEEKQPDEQPEAEAYNPLSGALRFREDKATPPTPERISSDVGRFELDLGIKWLSRIGIVALLIGFAMALSYSFPSFTKEMKILTGVLLASGLFAGGSKLFNNAPVLGRILQGGGISVGYLSLFAAFFIPDVQLLQFPELGLVLLFAYVGLVLSLAHKLNSQTVAILSLAFGYYTATYAEAAPVALMSAALLSLATVVVTKFHQDWRVLPKINLAGALFTYLFWHDQGSLRSQPIGQIYLLFTFMMFHGVSVLRGEDGDTLLNLLNSFGCYFLYSVTQPGIEPKGTLEFLMAGVQLGTLLVNNSLRPEQRESGLSYGLLVISLLFLAAGLLEFFEEATIPAVMASFTLALGLLSRGKLYKTIMTASTYIWLWLTYMTLLRTWGDLTDQALILTMVWITLVTILLESQAFKHHFAVVRYGILGFSLLFMLAATLDAVPDQWRTITFVLTAFVFLAYGFAQRLKRYRWLGLGWLFIVGGLSLLTDLWMLETLYKILLFILLGVGLLGGSYAYSLLEKRLLPAESRTSQDE